MWVGGAGGGRGLSRVPGHLCDGTAAVTVRARVHGDRASEPRAVRKCWGRQGLL